MPKVMLINVTHSEESRVAIVNEGLLDQFEIESQSRAYLKGNIYKGVVHRIHPALEAAFVDIGADRDAFLPLDEICFRNLPTPPTSPTRGEEDGGRRKLRIREVLRPGQEILVQIVKEQFANKPPTVTTFYSLPGRYLVLLPGTEDVGISRRIEGDDRVRLRKLVDELSLPTGLGLIVRTVAGLEDAGRELQLDLDYLKRLWDNIQRDARAQATRSLVYREHDLVLRTIRDFYTPDIDDIYIDDEEVYERARNFLDTVMPSARASMHLYQGEQPIFSAFNLESQIETVFRRRVPLRSGGSIVIDTTEALTAVDVNSGGSVRGANPEETAFRTNREAAREVARQLRLRDIGGLIVVDFIDMREGKHIQEIETAMREEMHIDKARHEVGRISGFGLMQISRQRLRPAATTTTYTSCPMCEGHGSVRTTESAALSALRKIHNRISLGDVESMRVALPVNVATYLLNQKRDELARLESRYQCVVDVQLRADLMPHQVEIDVRERAAEAPQATPGASKQPSQRTAAAPAAATGQRPAAAAQSAAAANERPAPASANGDSAAGSGKRKRRRRGRRRGGRVEGQAATANGNGSAVNGHDAPPVGEELDADTTAAAIAASPAPVTKHAAAEAGATAPDESAGASTGGEPRANGATESTAVAATNAAETSPARSSNRRRRGRGRRPASAPAATAPAAEATAPSTENSSPAKAEAAPTAVPARVPASASTAAEAAPEPSRTKAAEKPAEKAAEDTAPAKKKRAPARKRATTTAAAGAAKPATRKRKPATATKKTAAKTTRSRAKSAAAESSSAADD